MKTDDHMCGPSCAMHGKTAAERLEFEAAIEAEQADQSWVEEWVNHAFTAPGLGSFRHLLRTYGPRAGAVIERFPMGAVVALDPAAADHHIPTHGKVGVVVGYDMPESGDEGSPGVVVCTRPPRRAARGTMSPVAANVLVLKRVKPPCTAEWIRAEAKALGVPEWPVPRVMSLQERVFEAAQKDGAAWIDTWEPPDPQRSLAMSRQLVAHRRDAITTALATAFPPSAIVEIAPPDESTLRGVAYGIVIGYRSTPTSGVFVAAVGSDIDAFFDEDDLHLIRYVNGVTSEWVTDVLAVAVS